MKVQYKMVRKRGGRTYKHTLGNPIPLGWAIEDEKGRVFETEKAALAANKPKVVKPVVKKKVAVKKTEDTAETADKE